MRAAQVPPLVRKAMEALRSGEVGAELSQVRDRVARQVGVSSRQLNQLLKERTGRTFADLLREARIERACDLLVKTEESVAEIAHETGFCDQSYFTHVFQKLKRTTPRQYRAFARKEPRIG